MGTSGAMSTSNQYVKYSITISTNWQSVGENYSSVNVKVNFWRTNSGYQTYGTGVCYCKINGTTYSASVSSSQKITNSGITLFNRDVAVGHNSDGSKYLDTSAWISMDTPLSSSEQWYGEWLTTIPRASSISSINGNTIGSSITVNISRASSSFTHKVDYVRPDGEHIRIGENVGTSCTFTPSLSDSNFIPNSTSATAKIYVYTYSGSTYIGSSSKDFTLYVPSSVVPTINSVTLTENTSGIASKFGCYVQGKSTIKGVVSASGAYSSAIKSYSISINGQSFSQSSFTTNALTGSGTCTVKITDSRSRTASKNVSYSAQSYANPTINNFTVTRCNQDGTENDEGAYAKCTLKATLSSVNNKNDKTFQLLYKKLTDSSYTTINLSNSSYSYESTQIIQADINSEYEFIFRISDYFSTSQKSLNLGTAFTLVDYNSSGRALSIGKVSTNDKTFDVSLRTIFNESLDISGISNFRNYANFYEVANFYNPVPFYNSVAFYSDTTINGERMIFESGSWTPNLRSRSGTNPTSAVQYRYAKYKRINNLCYVTFHGKWNISNAGTDFACVTGLPYKSVGSGLNGQSLALHEMFGAITNNATRVGVIPDNSTRIDLNGEHGAYASQWKTGDVWVGFSGFYLIAT